jgi:predicted lipid-binding transport protein (Tim44 family)
VGLRSLFRPGRRGAAAAARAEQVRRASAEAADEDPLFDAELVERRAAALFAAVQRAWSQNDVGTLRRLVGPDLMVEWEARLADFRRKGLRNVVDVLDGPEVHYVGMQNREGDDEDRVVVLLRARLRDVAVDRHGRTIPSPDGEVANIREFWTLGKRGGDWVVVSIEDEREGGHHLSAPIVAGPSRDDARLRADAVMELAAADAVPAAQVGELLSPAFDGPARTAALDLSLVDGRFAPDVLATAVGELVDAWLQAIDGPDAPLAARATPDALRALLHPTGSETARLVVRGAQVVALGIVDVATGPPPEVAVRLEVEGIHYIEDRRTTEVLAGSRRRSTRRTQRWTLRLSDDPRRPWIIAGVEGAAG